MKALVAYYSESDNTKKLAEALASGLETEAVRLEAVNPWTLHEYDLICLGTPVQYGAPAAVVREFVARMPPLNGKSCAAFCTMHAFGAKATLRTMKTWLEAKGMVYRGGCSARGWSRLVANFGPRIFNRGHPNADELSRARELGRSLAQTVGHTRVAPPPPRTRPSNPRPQPTLQPMGYPEVHRPPPAH
jgi:flavodoxin